MSDDERGVSDDEVPRLIVGQYRPEHGVRYVQNYYQRANFFRPVKSFPEPWFSWYELARRCAQAERRDSQGR